MNSEVEPLMQGNSAAVWADDAPAHTRAKLPGIKMLVTLATLAMLVAIGGSLWTYVSGSQSMHALADQVFDNSAAAAASSHAVGRVMEQANLWAMRMALAGLASCLALFGVAILSGQGLRRRWISRHLIAAEESDVRSQRLLGQLADARVSEEESRKAQIAIQARLSTLSLKHGEMQKELASTHEELEQLRQTEKSLAQHTTVLERSKDVLEMHVQARTQELQKLQRRNELILNSAAEGICGFDLQNRTTFVNPAVAKLTGWKVEELIGKSEDAIFFPAKSRGAKDAPGLLKAADGAYLPEQTLFRKDSSAFPAEYVRTSLMENGRVVGTMVMVKDITERKSAEDKLNRKAAELARSNRELEQFAFVASHDLQEPLRKIQAFGDRLKVKCDAVQLEEGRDYLERMQSAAARMQTLINDLLTFSRVISSSQPFVKVDLGAVTQEVLVDLEVRTEKTHAQVTVAKLPTLQADPTQMRQLLQNLIGNALKFQTADAVPVIKIDAQLITRDQISEEASLPNQAPNADPTDEFCVLTVQDNGIGFDEQYLEKVFAVFQRLHGRSEYEGTGVGLAVCRRIAERHGGLITAQSKSGEGSTFIVILPMHQPKVEAQP